MAPLLAVRRLMIRHFFTVDVEEHFQVSAFEPYVSRDSWDRHESRVSSNAMRLLEILDRHGTTATFFTLGWVAERYPDLVRRIANAGHEVASHGYGHQRITHITPDEFRSDVRRAKQVLEEASGSPVLGYRAPSYSLVRGLEWALDILIEEGHQYDSSLFPVRRPGYGYAGGAREPHWIERPAGRILEVPPATLRRFGMTLPAAGGAYFRIFPYALVRSALRQMEQARVPGTFYLHPWEVDPDQPRLAVSTAARFRHYTGLSRTMGRLDRLLAEFRFTAIRTALEDPALIGS